MDKRALETSKVELSRADAALARLKAAQDLPSAESAWSDFLTSSHRIFSKLEQGAKGDAKTTAWFGIYKHARRIDPVLRYVHHARNADEHGIVAITRRKSATLALGVGPGTWRFDGTIGPGGHMQVTALGGQVEGTSKFVEFTPAGLVLEAVKDRVGNLYDPPVDENGTPRSPISLAEEAFSRIRVLVAEAEALG